MVVDYKRFRPSSVKALPNIYRSNENRLTFLLDSGTRKVFKGVYGFVHYILHFGKDGRVGGICEVSEKKTYTKVWMP